MNIISSLLWLQVAASPQASGQLEAVQMQKTFIAAAHKLRDELKDSDSAKFKEVYLHTTVGTDQKFHHGVCGKINAKNGFGGYIGWRIFWSNGNILEIEDRSDPTTLAPEICSNPSAKSWTERDLSTEMTRLVQQN